MHSFYKKKNAGLLCVLPRLVMVTMWCPASLGTCYTLPPVVLALSSDDLPHEGICFVVSCHRNQIVVSVIDIAERFRGSYHVGHLPMFGLVIRMVTTEAWARINDRPH